MFLLLRRRARTQSGHLTTTTLLNANLISPAPPCLCRVSKAAQPGSISSPAHRRPSYCRLPPSRLSSSEPITAAAVSVEFKTAHTGDPQPSPRHRRFRL
ncbi:hypothetical protein M0R45_002042 [Rubus argutus]|uniref:Uncharacterized protein n=1 Tax=Rubus argutus TaxID=59490 RepID=A0AAW1VJW1_RUBAR